MTPAAGSSSPAVSASRRSPGKRRRSDAGSRLPGRREHGQQRQGRDERATRGLDTCPVLEPRRGCAKMEKYMPGCWRQIYVSTRFLPKPSSGWEHTSSDAATRVLLPRRAPLGLYWATQQEPPDKPNGATPQHDGATRRGSRTQHSVCPHPYPSHLLPCSCRTCFISCSSEDPSGPNVSSSPHQLQTTELAR